MTEIICGLCHGTQNLTWKSSKERKWMACPACDGNGVEDTFGPKLIGMKNFDVEVKKKKK